MTITSINYVQDVSLWDEAQLLFHEHNKVMENLILFIRQIADQSNLILDPSLDSYYLMDLTVNRFPALIVSFFAGVAYSFRD